jgi:hypothetical protein
MKKLHILKIPKKNQKKTYSLGWNPESRAH